MKTMQLLTVLRYNADFGKHSLPLRMQHYAVQSNTTSNDTCFTMQKDSRLINTNISELFEIETVQTYSTEWLSSMS